MVSETTKDRRGRRLKYFQSMATSETWRGTASKRENQAGERAGSLGVLFGPWEAAICRCEDMLLGRGLAFASRPRDAKTWSGCMETRARMATRQTIRLRGRADLNGTWTGRGFSVPDPYPWRRTYLFMYALCASLASIDGLWYGMVIYFA